METEDLRLKSDEACNLEVQQSSGDVDSWENVIFERTPVGSLIIRTLDDESTELFAGEDVVKTIRFTTSHLVAEYAPGMWMKWEVVS